MILGNFRTLPTDKQAIEVYTAQPDTFVADYIFLTTLNSICRWVVATNYTGYQSLSCGTLQLLTSELEAGVDVVLAMGQELPRAGNEALYYKLSREGRKVTPAAWVKGNMQICDLTATTFRMPDLRDTFPRFYGASRGSGSYQTDAIREITGAISTWSGSATGGVSGAFALTNAVLGAATTGGVGYNVNQTFKASGSVPTATENRPVNTAFVPAITR